MDSQQPETRADRLFEEWQANNDLFQFHEELKQKRFSYLIGIQTAFIALYGVLVKEATGGTPSIWALLVAALITIPALVIVWQYSSMDDRARAYIDVIKGKLLLLEQQWAQEFPSNCFSTYSEQFDILVHRNDEVITRYLAVRGLGGKDTLRENLSRPAAHANEKYILRVFLIFRIGAFLAAIALLCFRYSLRL